LIGQVPESLVIGCPEDETGAIQRLPDGIDLNSYHALACGPGLSPKPKAIVQQLLKAECPIVLDADGLNLLSELGTIATLKERTAATVLTPHPGEFKRLFPDVPLDDRVAAVRAAAEQSGAIVLLKGSRTAIATPAGRVWLNPASTPALARGGSGDVLTGLMGGLIAQGIARQTPIKSMTSIEAMVCSAAGWHAQAAIAAAHDRTELGVDASTLIDYLLPTLRLLMEISGCKEFV
ncbi:MAG: NAD(P)H-hydrate dehydratase, partial [Microcoleus sp. SIO2G3]|nr:NAD(P)H-hydrate dehydratase [Microcoleus sp. SIO2G3]